MRRSFLGCTMLALVLALVGCAPEGPRLSAAGVVPGGVPVTPEHTLSPNDQLEIRFPFAADYNDQVTVGLDGTVSPKAVGSIQVGGLTVPEATERLKLRYAKLLKSPELSITIRRYAPEVVYVDGWVARPGLIRSDVPLTLERALAQVGGVKTGARTGDILIMRNGGDGTVQTYSAALGSYAGAGGADPLLKSFDAVYVPRTALAAVADFAKQYYANVPFSASFNVSRQATPSIIAPGLTTPAPAPAPSVTPR